MAAGTQKFLVGAVEELHVVLAGVVLDVVDYTSLWTLYDVMWFVHPWFGELVDVRSIFPRLFFGVKPFRENRM